MKEYIRAVYSRLESLDTQVELTKGGIGKPLLVLTLPVLITNLLQMAFNLIDTFWLGRHSTEALAAVSFAFPVVFLLLSLGIGLSIAGSILVAQKEGADNHKGAEFAASQTLLYISIISIFMGLLGYFAAEAIVTILGAEQEIIPLAASYLEIVSLGMVLIFGYSVFNSLMRGYGDTFTPMMIMLFSVILNAIIDPILIFGWFFFPSLGVEGAAYATLISRGIGFLIGIGVLFSGIKGLEISLSHFYFDYAFLKEMLKLGIPASLELTSRSLSVNVILFIVAMFTTPVVAAFGVVTRIYSAVYLPSIAVSRSVETMTGQNIGADKPERAIKANNIGVKYTASLLAALSLVLIAFAGPVISIFSSDPEVISAGSEFLRILAVSFAFVGIMRVYTGGFRGAGKTVESALIVIGSLWIVRIPIAWFGAQTLGETGVWISFPISSIIGALAAYVYFKSGNWLED